VPALENQIYLHPSLLDTQRKPLHTRSILIIVMFVMIMTIQHPGQRNNFLCCVFHRLQFVVSGCCGLVFFLHGSSSRLQHYKKLMIKNRGNWRGGWRGTDYYMFILHISINLSLSSFCISDWVTHVVLWVNGVMWSLGHWCFQWTQSRTSLSVKQCK